MSKNSPGKSKLFNNCDQVSFCTVFNLRKKNRQAKARPAVGRLIKKHLWIRKIGGRVSLE